MLEPSLKMLREDECVGTEGVPTERGLLEFGHVLRLTQTGAL